MIDDNVTYFICIFFQHRILSKMNGTFLFLSLMWKEIRWKNDICHDDGNDDVVIKNGEFFKSKFRLVWIVIKNFNWSDIIISEQTRPMLDDYYFLPKWRLHRFYSRVYCFSQFLPFLFIIQKILVTIFIKVWRMKHVNNFFSDP